MYDFKQTAAQRGYKQPGQKLKVRCGYMASEMQAYGIRSLREFNRRNASEVAAYGGYRADPHIRRMEAAFDALGQCQQRKVYEALAYNGDGRKLLKGVRLLRAYDEAQKAQAIDECIRHDEMLWRNAM